MMPVLYPNWKEALTAQLTVHVNMMGQKVKKRMKKAGARSVHDVMPSSKQGGPKQSLICYSSAALCFCFWTLRSMMYLFQVKTQSTRQSMHKAIRQDTQPTPAVPSYSAQ